MLGVGLASARVHQIKRNMFQAQLNIAVSRRQAITLKTHTHSHASHCLTVSHIFAPLSSAASSSYVQSNFKRGAGGEFCRSIPTPLTVSLSHTSLLPSLQQHPHRTCNQISREGQGVSSAEAHPLSHLLLSHCLTVLHTFDTFALTTSDCLIN